MIVVAINDGYVERGLRQLLGRRKAAESCPDDDDARAPGTGVVGNHDVLIPVCTNLSTLMLLPEWPRPRWHPEEQLGWNTPRIWTRHPLQQLRLSPRCAPRLRHGGRHNRQVEDAGPRLQRTVVRLSAASQPQRSIMAHV